MLVTIGTTRQATAWQEDKVSDYAVTNPATGELVKAYLTIGDAELADAIATADRAHREWSRTATIEERAALVRRVGELHLERRGELLDPVGG